jgi:hypothetical protein
MLQPTELPLLLLLLIELLLVDARMPRTRRAMQLGLLVGGKLPWPFSFDVTAFEPVIMNEALRYLDFQCYK